MMPKQFRVTRHEDTIVTIPDSFIRQANTNGEDLRDVAIEMAQDNPSCDWEEVGFGYDAEEIR
jgi:hypothetical protein